MAPPPAPPLQMDLILHYADELFLDKLYAGLIPVADFFADNATTFAPPAWAAFLPDPHIAPNASLYAHLHAAPVSAWSRDYLPRQILSISVITIIGINLLYLVFASLSYYLIFDHNMMRHPRFLKNQVALEIQTAIKAFPGMTVLTLPWFIGEVRGYSRLYQDPAEYGYAYLAFSAVLCVSHPPWLAAYSTAHLFFFFFWL